MQTIFPPQQITRNDAGSGIRVASNPSTAIRKKCQRVIPPGVALAREMQVSRIEVAFP